MDTRKVTLIATIAAIALLAVGVGYAYTATTENSSNSADSNYIVLSQDNYSWGSTELYLNTTTKSTGYTFQLAKGGTGTDSANPAEKIEGTGSTDAASYYGVQVGAVSNFSLYKVGDVSAGPYKVTIPPTGGTSGLVNPTGTYWSYIIVFQDNDTGTSDDDEYQYIYSADGTTWTYVGVSGSTAKTDGVYLKDSTTYAVSLYFGGFAVEYSTGHYTAQDSNPPAGTTPSSYVSTIIGSGTIKFGLEFDKPSA